MILNIPKSPELYRVSITRNLKNRLKIEKHSDPEYLHIMAFRLNRDRNEQWLTFRSHRQCPQIIPRNPIYCFLMTVGLVLILIIAMSLSFPTIDSDNKTYRPHDPRSDAISGDAFSPGLCFKCTHSVDPTFIAPQQCHLLDTLKTAELVNHTSLPVDGEQKGCPIETDDDLYPFISRMMESEETVFEQLAHFDAPELMVTDPPRWYNLTKSLQDEFTMNGRAPGPSPEAVAKGWGYWNQVQNGGKSHWQTSFQWPEERINEYIARVMAGDFAANKNPYGGTPGFQLWTLLSSGRFGETASMAEALVIGSQSPWLEAILLAKGMKHGVLNRKSLWFFVLFWTQFVVFHSDHGGVRHHQCHSSSNGVGASFHHQQGGR